MLGLSWGEVSGFVALLGVIGTFGTVIFRSWRKGAIGHEDRLWAREQLQDENTRQQLATMKDELREARKVQSALTGLVQVMIDYHIIHNPRDPALAAMAENIRRAFPDPSMNTPPEIVALMLRLDARTKE